MIDFRTQLVAAAQYKIGYDKIKSGYYGILRLPNGSIAYHSHVPHANIDDAKTLVAEMLTSKNKIETDYLQTYVDVHVGFDVVPVNDDKPKMLKSAKIVKPIADSVASEKGLEEWNNWIQKAS